MAFDSVSWHPLALDEFVTHKVHEALMDDIPEYYGTNVDVDYPSDHLGPAEREPRGTDPGAVDLRTVERIGTGQRGFCVRHNWSA